MNTGNVNQWIQGMLTMNTENDNQCIKRMLTNEYSEC